MGGCHSVPEVVAQLRSLNPWEVACDFSPNAMRLHCRDGLTARAAQSSRSAFVADEFYSNSLVSNPSARAFSLTVRWTSSS